MIWTLTLALALDLTMALTMVMTNQLGAGFESFEQRGCSRETRDRGLHLQGECSSGTREPLVGEQDEGVLLSCSESCETQPGCSRDGGVFVVSTQAWAPCLVLVLISRGMMLPMRTREIQHYESKAFGCKYALSAAQSCQGLLGPYPEYVFEDDSCGLG